MSSLKIYHLPMGSQAKFVQDQKLKFYLKHYQEFDMLLIFYPQNTMYRMQLHRVLEGKYKYH